MDTILEKLKLQLIKKEAKVLKGSRHTIVCEISGKPRATKIWWTKNDVEQIDGDSDGLKATLVFEEFLLTDEGCYKCHATNPAGTFYSDPMSLICIGWYYTFFNQTHEENICSTEIFNFRFRNSEICKIIVMIHSHCLMMHIILVNKISMSKEHMRDS